MFSTADLLCLKVMLLILMYFPSVRKIPVLYI